MLVIIRKQEFKALNLANNRATLLEKTFQLFRALRYISMATQSTSTCGENNCSQHIQRTPRSAYGPSPPMQETLLPVNVFCQNMRLLDR